MKLSLPPFGNARVLVLGDIMLDRYWQGETSRVSPEAPVPARFSITHAGTSKRWTNLSKVVS